MWVNAEEAGACGRTARRWISPGFTLGVGIDKHGAAALAERFGKFRGELMAGDDFNVLAGESPGKQAAGVPAEPVVTPQRIAVADDEAVMVA